MVVHGLEWAGLIRQANVNRVYFFNLYMTKREVAKESGKDMQSEPLNKRVPSVALETDVTQERSARQSGKDTQLEPLNLLNPSVCL